MENEINGCVPDGNCCVWIKQTGNSYIPMFLNERNLNETYILHNIYKKHGLTGGIENYRITVESENGHLKKDCFLRLERKK